jgi:hypothetical protein
MAAVADRGRRAGTETGTETGSGTGLVRDADLVLAVLFAAVHGEVGGT